jgi:RNA polymerase sigma-70 factor (ECF subfamily)
LLGVARLQLRNATRSKARYLAALSRAGREAVAQASLADPADVVARRLDDAQHVKELRAAIGRLPWQQREVIELCVYAGLDQQAAALSLGVSVGTVKSRLHRARQRLANELRAPQSARGRGEEL